MVDIDDGLWCGPPNDATVWRSRLYEVTWTCWVFALLCPPHPCSGSSLITSRQSVDEGTILKQYPCYIFWWFSIKNQIGLPTFGKPLSLEVSNEKTRRSKIDGSTSQRWRSTTETYHAKMKMEKWLKTEAHDRGLTTNWITGDAVEK